MDSPPAVGFLRHTENFFVFVFPVIDGEGRKQREFVRRRQFSDGLPDLFVFLIPYDF